MKLEEIIEIVKHDAEYFADHQNAVQAGRCFEAKKILRMLYLIKPAQLQQHNVVRGAVTSHCLSLKDECEFTNTCPECTKPATEPLPAEGEAQGVCAGDKHGPIKRHKRRIYCGTCLKVLLHV